MSSRNKAREQARKREAAERRAAQERLARRDRRIRLGAVIAIGALVLGSVTALVIATVVGRGGDEPAASASVDPTTATSAPAPDPTATVDEGVEFATGWGASPAPPDPSYAEGRPWTVTLQTNQGPITLTLDGTAAPQAVASFVKLAEDGFFDNTDCHRLTTAGIYVLQCGDPTGLGSGGPSYRFGPIENAPADDVYPKGTLAMARVQDNAESNGSQFFLVYQDSTIASDSAGGYTVFGTVTDGLGIVESVAQAGTLTGETDGRPAVSVIINEVTVE